MGFEARQRKAPAEQQTDALSIAKADLKDLNNRLLAERRYDTKEVPETEAAIAAKELEIKNLETKSPIQNISLGSRTPK